MGIKNKKGQSGLILLAVVVTIVVILLFFMLSGVYTDTATSNFTTAENATFDATINVYYGFISAVWWLPIVLIALAIIIGGFLFINK
jgi:uncharacterized protein YneF (UPF0154 family)